MTEYEKRHLAYALVSLAGMTLLPNVVTTETIGIVVWVFFFLMMRFHLSQFEEGDPK